MEREPIIKELIHTRWCCPADQSLLMTILEQKLVSYAYETDCINCMTKYREEKTI